VQRYCAACDCDVNGHFSLIDYFVCSACLILLVGGQNTRQTNPKMADGRHLEKSKIGHISAKVGPIGTEFGKKTHIGLNYRTDM